MTIGLLLIPNASQLLACAFAPTYNKIHVGGLQKRSEFAVQFISRVVGGWNVRMMLKGKRHGKFFADSRHGGKRKSLAAAQAYRDDLVASRPKPKPKAARPVVVVRGKARYLQIRIPTRKGSTTTEFSLSRHGPEKARRLAIKAYKAATSEFVN